jgi:hypothetical protein
VVSTGLFAVVGGVSTLEEGMFARGIAAAPDEWEEAEQLKVQVMETSRMKLGADHPSTLTIMNNLAFTWKGLGRDAEAIQLMSRVAN